MSMLHRLAFTALRLNRPEPERDHHPLARADGGWYPGKHFDPTDILTDPRNWHVWKQFLIFFFSMIGLPIATFLGIEMVLRNQFQMHVNQSTTIGALASMIVLQALVFTYVRLAAIENNEPDPEEVVADQEGVATEVVAAPGVVAAEEVAGEAAAEVLRSEEEEATKVTQRKTAKRECSDEEQVTAGPSPGEAVGGEASPAAKEKLD